MLRSNHKLVWPTHTPGTPGHFTANSESLQGSVNHAQLYIRMLGEFQVWRNRVPLTNKEWKTHREKTLLKILLTHQGHIILQDQLIEMLWPGMRDSAALNNLWVTISYLRSLLQPDLKKPSDSHFIMSQAGGYKFNTAEGCRSDIDEFQAQAAAGSELYKRGQFHAAIFAYRMAAELYTGEFLEEDRYEEWTITRRMELSQQYLHLLKNLADCHLALEQYQEALAPYQKILSLQPCWEGIWRKVMVCHWLSGERDQALFAYLHCQEILKKQLKVAPMASTEELRDKIRRGDLSVAQLELFRK